LDRIEDVQYEVYLLNKHATEGRENCTSRPRSGQTIAKVASCRGIFIQSRFNLIKKLIKLLNCLKLKIVAVIFENYRGRNNVGIFWDK